MKFNREDKYSILLSDGYDTAHDLVTLAAERRKSAFNC